MNKKRKCWKKGLLAVCVLTAALLALVGCGQSSTKAPYEVTLDKSFICGTYDGDALVLNLKVKNTGKEIADLKGVAYGVEATLDGKALSTSYMDSENPNTIESSSVAAGEEGTAQVAFALGDATEGEVQILATDYAEDKSAKVETLKTTINLADVERLETKSDYDLTIDKVETTDDGEGHDLVVLDMTFTNNSAEASSFSSAVNLELFQNDMSLATGYLPYNHPLNDNTLERNQMIEVKNGAKIALRETFILNDKTQPVQVSAKDRHGYDKAAILEKTIEMQ